MLFRIDFEALGLKAKTVLDAIAVCLGNKQEFTGDVVKEALRAMLVDPVPPYALMRTAILSGQSFSEVKRFVLGDVIPELVRKSVWASAPKLWEGVVYGAKNLAATGFKNSELTLRALLGVPAAQLKALVKVAPKVKEAMGKLLKTLSAEEKEEVITGRWAGLKDAGDGVVVTEEARAAAAAEIVKQAAEKLKVVKDIAATATI